MRGDAPTQAVRHHWSRLNPGNEGEVRTVRARKEKRKKKNRKPF